MPVDSPANTLVLPPLPRRGAIVRTVGALGVCQLVAFGTSFYLLTVLGEPIRSEMGWSQPQVIGGFTFGVLAAALIAGRAGRLVAQGYGREVLTLSAGFFALGLATVGISPNYGVYVAGWLLIGIGMGCGLYDIAFGTIGRSYGAKARATITQVALIGGFSSAIFWPLTSLLVHQFDWRTTCVVYAGVHLFVSAPLYWTCAPRLDGPRPPVTASDKHNMALGSAEWPAYLAVGFVIVAEMAVTISMSLYLLQILTARGANATEAVALAALVGPAQVAMRLIELTLGNRLHPRYSMALGIAAVAAGIGLITTGASVLVVALVLYGGGMGVASIARATLPLALFGSVRYPALMGRIGGISLVAQAGAPILMAFSVDRYGLDIGIMAIAVLAAVNFVVAVMLARLKSMPAAPPWRNGAGPNDRDR